jgi:hypothetical protein
MPIPVPPSKVVLSGVVHTSAGKFLKRVFFHLPFYVEVEGKSHMMNLTVYPPPAIAPTCKVADLYS